MPVRFLIHHDDGIQSARCHRSSRTTGIELTENGDDANPVANPLGGLSIDGGTIGFLIDRLDVEAWFLAPPWSFNKISQN